MEAHRLSDEQLLAHGRTITRLRADIYRVALNVESLDHADVGSQIVAVSKLAKRIQRWEKFTREGETDDQGQERKEQTPSLLRRRHKHRPKLTDSD